MENTRDYREEMNGAARTPKDNLMEAKRLILDASNNIYEDRKGDFKTQFSDIKASVGEMGDRVKESAIETKESIETQVKERPWTTVLGATAAGALLGFLMGRRSK